MPKLIFEVERGIPDFTGDGEFWLIIPELNIACLVPAVLCPPGVEGAGRIVFSRFGLLGLRASEGIEDGVDFFIVELGCLRIDFMRSNFPGLRKIPLIPGLGAVMLRLADFGIPRGVAFRLGFDGDLTRVGI